MDTKPLPKNRARMSKMLLNPVRAVLTALKKAFVKTPPEPPPRPPEKKLPPRPGLTKPPGLPDARPKPPQPTTTKARQLATVLGTDTATGQEVALTLEERFQGLYVIGATGTGKTTLLESMVLSDILNNLGLCLIEPYGDLTRNVIAAMPEERFKDVIYLDLTDPTNSFGLNFFECPMGADVTEAAKIASFVMHLFESIWNVGFETPRLATVLRNTARVLIENPGMSFSEIPLLLWEDVAREKLVRRVSNTQTKLFWSAYNRKQPRDREELIASKINEVDAYLNDPLIARIVSQSASTIDFRRIMDEGKILLVHLSPQLEEPSRLIGAAILGRLLLAAFSRADTPQDRRRPFMIYADEYQRFATQDFAVFLAEARKAKVSTTIANQVLEQISDLNRATALQAGTLVVMRVSGEDSKVLAPSFDATPQPTLVGEEPVRAVVADPLAHLVRHGHPHPTVATFVAEYLMPLESLAKKHASAPHPFGFGCTIAHPNQVLEGHRQLNESFATCMREGRSDVTLSPLSLFFLGGVADEESTYVFKKDLRYDKGLERLVYFLGFYGTSNSYGKPTFLTGKHEQAAVAFLRKMAKTRIFMWQETVDRRVAAFTRMLKALRATLQILAKEPLMTDTGLYQPKYQLRTYSDQENLVANDLSQLPNYTAKVRLLSGELTIKTRPAPPLVSERELEARIRTIKERMLREGVTRSVQAIEEEVAKRHEALRARPDEDDPPPLHSNGRRRPRR